MRPSHSISGARQAAIGRQFHRCTVNRTTQIRVVMKLLATSGMRVKAFLTYSWQTVATV